MYIYVYILSRGVPLRRNTITTNASVFELTVASRQRMTIERDNAGQSKECGSE